MKFWILLFLFSAVRGLGLREMTLKAQQEEVAQAVDDCWNQIRIASLYGHWCVVCVCTQHSCSKLVRFPKSNSYYEGNIKQHFVGHALDVKLESIERAEPSIDSIDQEIVDLVLQKDEDLWFDQSTQKFCWNTRTK